MHFDIRKERLAISKDVVPLNYECRRELFDLWRPYIGTTTTEHKLTGTKRKRKKQRTSQFNEQESEAVENHKKIRDILATSTLHIVSLGKKSGYFKEKIKDSCPVQSKGSFDVVVLDPPWYNKSAKRSGKYSFLSLWQIKSLPVPRLLSDQCLVVVWVTNKPKYINFTRGELFTHWSIEYLAEWHWVKVTRTGELVVDLDSPHKRPYETLILGRYNSSARYCNSEQCNVKSSEINADSIVDNSCTTNHEISSNQQQGVADIVDCVGGREHQCPNGSTGAIKDHLDDDCSSTVNDKGLPRHKNKHRKPIPDHLVICSVPCQIHSRKPHLQDILAEFVCPDAKCLEMFARNLTTGWTSWGNEVLKFQHTNYFDIKVM